jgi:hypothetical protein
MADRVARALLCASLTLSIFVGSLTRPDVAMAQAALPKYEVTGFREARFGMTEPQVRAIAKSSFAVHDGDMMLSTDAIAGTTKLVVHVQMLEPGLGVGRVEYLFGHTRHTLFQVNVVWGQDTNPQLSNAEMLDAAVRFQRYFLGFAWAHGMVRTGIPIGIVFDDRAIFLFSGADGRGGAVSVAVEDVLYGELPNGVLSLVPERSVGTRLTVSYIDGGQLDGREINRNPF